MTERERLIELLRKDNCCTDRECKNCLCNRGNRHCYPKETADFLLANGVRCMPFTAMIEQTTENGKFCKKRSEQKFNGRYCLVYEDKAKWGTPLIDICGTKAYNTEEVEAALEKLNGKR